MKRTKSAGARKWAAALTLAAAAAAAGCMAGDGDDNDSSTIHTSVETPTETQPGNANRFRVRLPNFGADVLEGYAACADLGLDVEEAGQYLANLAIEQNLRYYNDDLVTIMELGGAGEQTDGVSVTSDFGADNSGAPAPTATNTQSGLLADGGSKDETAASPDGFGTNNQVSGVDEADVVKSDGTLVYAAYGDELVVLDLSGRVLSRTEMPALEDSQAGLPNLNLFPAEPAPDASGGGSASSSGTTTEASAPAAGLAADIAVDSTSISILPGPVGPTQQIDSLLLNGGRVVAIVSGYDYGASRLVHGTTRALIYQVGADGLLSLLEQKALRGGYQAARSIGSDAHVVSMATIDGYALTERLSRWRSEYRGMTDAQYEAAAFAKAQELLPAWRAQLVGELLGDSAGAVAEGGCAHIVKVSLMRTGSAGDAEGGDAPDLTGGQGVLNGFAQVLSFDIQAGFADAAVAGAFLPTSYVNAYANEEVLFLAGQGWNQVGAEDWSEYTYLMGFNLDGATAAPSAVGQVPGGVLNQFSMDFHEGHLRVATTTSARWGRVSGEEWGQVSESENQVTVLRAQGDELAVVGQATGLGKGERIFAARFMGDRGFVVTFKQTDPFYTLDLSDPTNPRVVGDLKIPGFSNYLHPVGENHILAIGQDADEETGETKGLQVALFDVTDLANPVQAHKAVVDRWSSSGAQHDHRAFRYLADSGALILPVSVYDYQGNDFDGFQVYDVHAEEGISLRGEVTHADAELMKVNCYSPAYLQPRSLVFGGQLMTLKGHTVLSHDLATLAGQWSVNLDADLPEAECAPWFFYGGAYPADGGIEPLMAQ